MSSPSLQVILKKHGIRPKKSLGQHFLCAMPTIGKIVDALAPSPADDVIEIGPGPGIMTGLIAERARRCVAIDTDGAMIAVAREELAGRGNIAFLHGDILEQEIDGIAEACSAPSSGPFKLIGNLPYNISSPILFWMIERRAYLSRAVIMVQKEVARRIAASPGGKEYGILSVVVQCFARVEKLFDVSAKSFIPPPKVTSSVLRLDFTKPHEPAPRDEAFFRNVVRSAFGKRRKTLRNALLRASDLRVDAERLDAGLAAARIDPTRRPETLSIAEFLRLAEELAPR